jgi:sugar transferase (PEP-CTERM/EpsH1 system associated)
MKQYMKLPKCKYHKDTVVLHLIHYLTVGGAEQTLVNLVNYFPDNYRHVIISLMQYDEEFVKRIKNLAVTLTTFNKQPRNDFSIINKIKKLITEYEIDILLCWDWTSYLESIFAARLSLKFPPVIYAIHGKSYEELHGIPWRRKLIHKSMSYFVDAIITICEYTKKDYCHTYGIPPQKVQVIYNGIDTAKFNNGDINTNRLEFGLNKQHIVIGCIARLDRVKNIQLLIKAVADLKCKLVRLLIVGDGPEMDNLKKLSEDQKITNQIVFSGRRNDIPELLQIMDIYVQPSFFEGISLTILEAMACGLPVVATQVGGNPEIITDKYDGILIESDNTDELIQALTLLIKSEERRKILAEQARATIEKRFSLSLMVDNYANLFKGLLKN